MQKTFGGCTILRSSNKVWGALASNKYRGYALSQIFFNPEELFTLVAEKYLTSFAAYCAV